MIAGSMMRPKKRPRRGRGVARLAGLAFVAAMGIGLTAGLAPAEAAACDRNYCQKNPNRCISYGQMSQKAKSSAGSGWQVLDIRSAPDNTAPDCKVYVVKLAGPNGGKSKIVRLHVTGAYAR